MDGEKVARRVVHHVTKDMMHPRSAPFHSSYRYPTSNDIGWETG
jgi:hypothetical protein